ncbi:MAG: TIGR01906 family membrane protein [Firmicutes bacterium]|nr:TIGR01906 family membrane protein [Bacillota bacterium]
MNDKVKKKVLNILFAAVCAVVVICLAVSITVWMRPIYYMDINILDIPQRSGVPAEICRLNYDVLIDYNVIGGPDKLEFPDFVMSETGEIHFEEVKDIFIPMQWIGILGGLAVAAAIIWWKEKSWMHYSVIITVGIALAVLAAVIIDWEWAFETMHGIFFNNDYWIFDYRTDPVITILPDTFFMHCGLAIIAIVVIVMAAFEIIYRKQKKEK